MYQPNNSIKKLMLLLSVCVLAAPLAAKTKSAKAPKASTQKSDTLAPKTGQQIKIAYLTQLQPPPVALSNLDVSAPDKGEAGAQLAIIDNNTTGQFTGQNYQLDIFQVPEQGNPLELYTNKIAQQYAFVLLNLPATQINAIADTPTAKAQILLDVSNTDDALRNEQCRANVFHLLPSRAMRADALAQLMLKKRWQKWFLVVGPEPNDRLFAEALKHSAKRFGLKIVAEKTWDHTFENRRTEQADIPVFTQVDDYDVLAVADEQGLFGEYLAYRTWLPRPIMGTQGLIATAWHRTHEQWGASQIQNRFKEKNARWMEEQDYGAYLAVRAIGEAATRTKSNQAENIKNYLLSEQFNLQGYKGSPLSFRVWDRQLRQPILLAADRSIVGTAPIEGFLHPKTELDTLGYDQPETKCKLSTSP